MTRSIRELEPWNVATSTLTIRPGTFCAFLSREEGYFCLLYTSRDDSLTSRTTSISLAVYTFMHGHPNKLHHPVRTPRPSRVSLSRFWKKELPSSELRVPVLALGLIIRQLVCLFILFPRYPLECDSVFKTCYQPSCNTLQAN